MTATAIHPMVSWRSMLQFLYLLLGCALLVTGCGGQKTIVHELDELEANEILTLLASKGIQANKVKAEAGTGQKVTLWNITVDPERSDEAMSILNQNGLPRRRGQTLLGIFKETGLVPSEMQEKVKYQAGLAETIASTIRKMDGVLDAEVQISFPEEDPLNPTANRNKKITASVYVKHSALLDDPNVHLSTKIKRLVSSSITGLDYDNVTVILDRARFGDLPVGAFKAQEDKHFVNIWSIIVAEESVSRFRIVFFSFTILILLLLLALVWLSYKLYSVMDKLGGFKELFTLTPLHLATRKEDHDKDKEVEERSAEERKRRAAEQAKGKGEPGETDIEEP